MAQSRISGFGTLPSFKCLGTWHAQTKYSALTHCHEAGVSQPSEQLAIICAMGTRREPCSITKAVR
jgi:hypothetical protein